MTNSEQEFSYVNNYSKWGDIEEHLSTILGDGYREYRQHWNQAHTLAVEPEFPPYISIETELRCNYRCIMCSFVDPKEIDKQYYPEKMDDSLWNKILSDISSNYCPSMGMNVLNEPLLDRSIFQKIADAKAAGVLDIRMNTNASLLTEKNARSLIESGLTQLYVGLDAATEETYSVMRLKGNYERVMKNIKKFLEVREEYGGELPILRVSFVKTSQNEHEIPQFVSYWNDVADMVTIQEYLPPSLDNQSFEKLLGKTKIVAENYSCPQPNERMIIRGNGDVLPCCAQYGYKLKIGNLNDMSIKEIWNSEPYRELRAIMREGRWQENSVCKACLTNSYLKE